MFVASVCVTRLEDSSTFLSIYDRLPASCRVNHTRSATPTVNHPFEPDLQFFGQVDALARPVSGPQLRAVDIR